MNVHLLALERDPHSKDTLASIFRVMHTIKGTCGFLGFSRLERVAHAAESLLGGLRDGTLEVNPPIASALLATGDALRQMLNNIERTRSDGEDDFLHLVATLERWNETLPTGYDPEFLRHESLKTYGYPTPARIAEPPFYAVRTLPIGLIVTQAGLQIDEYARVIDRFGRVIPGLYAAGEAAGGILGPHYIGATSIASALTMGRRAGHHASGRSER